MFKFIRFFSNCLRVPQFAECGPVASSSSFTDASVGRAARAVFRYLIPLVGLSLALGFSGCGSNKAFDSSSLGSKGISGFTVSPTSIEFGSVNVGNAGNSKITLSNSGANPVVVSQLTLSNTAFTADSSSSLPLTLAVGATATFNVHFRPQHAGDVSAAITISSSVQSSTTSSSQPAGSVTATPDGQPQINSTTVKLHGKGNSGSAPSTATLSTLACNSASFTGSGTDTCTVTLTQAAPAGGFTVALASSNLSATVPATVTVAASATTATFTTTLTAVSASQTATITASANGVSTNFAILLNPSGTLSGLTCAQSSMVGAGTDTCTVSLGSAAPGAGVTVGLTSNNSAVKVPASVTVPASATSAQFTATVSSVSSATSVLIAANASQISKTFSLNLTPAVPTMSWSTSSLTFGNVALNSPASQSITLKSTGTAALSINGASATGSGFSVVGASLPVSLNPGQSTTLKVQFDPTAAGGASGQLTITSNSSTGSPTYILLSGTGVSTAVSLASFSCTTSSYTAAGTDSCTLGLSGAAPSGGLSVSIASSGSAVAVPSVVTVPAGSSSASFTATVSAVTTSETDVLTASAGGVSKTFSVQANAAAPTLSGVSCTTSSYTAAGTDSCTVTLGSAASSSGLTVALSSNNAAVTVPSSVTVASGATSASFTANVSTVSSSQTATLTATAGGVSKTFALQLAGAGSALSNLSCTTSNYSAAGTDSCTVTLSSASPSGGTVVSLSSSGSAVTVPSSVTVPSGSTSAAFTANVAAVTTTQTDTLTASASGVNKTFALQLSSPSPTLSSLSCGTSSYTGAGSDACTVTLSGGAPSGGFAVALSSSSSSVTVPSSVTVASGATSAGFTATVAAVTSSQTATLSATAGSVNKTFSLQLSTSGSGSGGHNYSTTFPLTENPVSESGNWINGGTTGLDWHDCQTTGGSPGFAFGSEPGTVNYDDTTCVLTGSWGPSQTAQITVKVNSTSGAAYQEVEVRLHTSITAHSITGYEINCSVIPGNPYVQIVRWNGPLGSFTELNGTSSTGCASGDVLKASISGSTITAYKNGTAVLTASDSSYAGGSPGMGFYIQSPNGSAATANGAFGASAFSATDGLSSGSTTSVTPASLSCSSASMTGSGSNTCTVTLSAAAPSGGLTVSLASSSTAVTLPATLTVPAGSTTASLTASVAAVSTTQTATLTASANGAAASFAVQLNAAPAALTINSTSIAFGNVVLSAPATQSLTLSSTGGSAVTVNSATLVGVGYSVSGATFPLTLNPGQSATLNVQFQPTVLGLAAGVLTITSSASSLPTATIALSGTGVAAAVTISWSAPVDLTDPAVSYNVYRATGTSTTYQKMNSTADLLTTYVDSGVTSGTAYQYYITSLDAAGNESSPSTSSSVTVP